jgi:hypothetical protein
MTSRRQPSNGRNGGLRLRLFGVLLQELPLGCNSAAARMKKYGAVAVGGKGRHGDRSATRPRRGIAGLFGSSIVGERLVPDG